MYESDIVVLTGAGASIPVGIPGMAGMAKEFRQGLSNNSEIYEGYEIIRDLKISEDIEDILQIVNFLVEFPKHTVNAFVENCIAPRGGEGNLSSYRDRRDSDVQKISKLREELLRYITTKCLRYNRKKAKIIYQKLVKKLAENDIPVYTTNYDAVFNHAAHLNNIPVIDNFVADKFGREYWDTSLNAFYNEGFKLIKIHGSIQWHATKDGRIEKISQPATVNQEGEELQQLLIFPTRFKDIYTQNYFPLYSSFTRTLGQSKLLIVIGHSLRDEYLLAAIRDRLRDKNFRLVVIAPDFPMRKKLIVGNGQIRDRILHISNSIEDVFPLIIQVVDGFSVDNIFEHLETTISKIRHNKKESIHLDPPPRWISSGDMIETELQIESLIGGTIEFYFYPEKLKSKKIKLEAFFEDSNSDNIFGKHNLKIPLKIKLPSEISDGKHYLNIDLVGHDGNQSVSKQYTLETRKDN